MSSRMILGLCISGLLLTGYLFGWLLGRAERRSLRARLAMFAKQVKAVQEEAALARAHEAGLRDRFNELADAMNGITAALAHQTNIRTMLLAKVTDAAHAADPPTAGEPEKECGLCNATAAEAARGIGCHDCVAKADAILEDTNAPEPPEPDELTTLLAEQDRLLDTELWYDTADQCGHTNGPVREPFCAKCQNGYAVIEHFVARVTEPYEADVAQADAVLKETNAPPPTAADEKQKVLCDHSGRAASSSGCSVCLHDRPHVQGVDGKANGCAEARWCAALGQTVSCWPVPTLREMAAGLQADMQAEVDGLRVAIVDECGLCGRDNEARARGEGCPACKGTDEEAPA